MSVACEAKVELAAGLVAVLEQSGVMGAARVAVFGDGTLMRVLPGEPLAVWPVETIAHLLVEAPAVPPARTTLHVRTAMGRELVLAGALAPDALLPLLQLEERLLVG